MNIKWKRNKKFKPSLILRKIDQSKKLKNGEVQFENFDFFNVITMLLSMIEFPEILKGLSKEKILSNSVFELARDNELTPDKLIEKIKMHVRNEISVREKQYSLLTTISLREPFF